MIRARPKFVLWFEEAIAFLSCAVIILLPIFDKLIQKLFVNSGGVPNSNLYVSFSVVALCFSASILTTRERKHLNIGIISEYGGPRLKNIAEAFSTFLSVVVTLVYTICSTAFLFTGIEASKRVGPIPERVLLAIMPLAFLIMLVYFIRYSALTPRLKLGLALPALLFGLYLSAPALVDLSASFSRPGLFDWLNGSLMAVYPYLNIVWALLLIVGALGGAPIFVVLAGLAFTFFTKEQIPISSIPTEPLRMLRDEMIPALPLFTICGYILSESKAGQRLINVFRQLFGWMPGGSIVVAVLICTFFTTFTGASGVTILALGLLLAMILKESGTYSEGFVHGILTASGSIGLLLPPSLAVIIYAVIASLDIIQLFLATLLPGLLLVLAMCVAGLGFSRKTKSARQPFHIKLALKSMLDAIWELLLPVGIVCAYFLGWATIPEAAAFAVLYVLIVEVLIRREIPFKKLPNLILKALSVVGGTLIILATARGLALYIIMMDVPGLITAWVASFVSSKLVFLLLLNLLLLVVGCFLDVFSAIMVVAPLIFPLGLHFGINPYHLASIFILNLGIGFLTPPVGMNLFIASYTFERPLTRIYKNVLPYLGVQLVVLVIVTYIPWFSTVFLKP